MLLDFPKRLSNFARRLSLKNVREASRRIIYGPVAQLVEQWPLKPLVEGSSPSGVTRRQALFLDEREGI